MEKCFDTSLLCRLQKIISTWAKGLGAAQMKANQYGVSGGMPWGFGCANTLVLSKIKEALGLDATKLCCVGAAPIAVETLEYFGSLGINVFEGFGQVRDGRKKATIYISSHVLSYIPALIVLFISSAVFSCHVLSCAVLCCPVLVGVLRLVHCQCPGSLEGGHLWPPLSRQSRQSG